MNKPSREELVAALKAATSALDRVEGMLAIAWAGDFVGLAEVQRDYEVVTGVMMSELRDLIAREES